jgi:hypothetical protein
MNADVVDRFLQLRQGPDGIDGTEDDMQFKTPAEIWSALGLNPQQSAQLEKFVVPNSTVYRVTSVGTAGTAKRTVQMVFRRVGVTPQLITWKEY